MGKKRALAHIGEVLSKPEMRGICERLELTADVTQLVLERFCDGKTIEQCSMPPAQQRTAVPRAEWLIVGQIIQELQTLPEYKRERLQESLKTA